MKKNKKYKVYTKKGEFHHGYNASLKGSLSWAIDCAKTINGSVVEVDENGEEKVFGAIPNFKKQKILLQSL